MGNFRSVSTSTKFINGRKITTKRYLNIHLPNIKKRAENLAAFISVFVAGLLKMARSELKWRRMVS